MRNPNNSCRKVEEGGVTVWGWGVAVPYRRCVSREGGVRIWKGGGGGWGVGVVGLYQRCV